VCDLGTESSVVHQQHIKIFHISYEEFLESVGEEEFGGVVGSVTDFGHFFVASESASHSVVDAWVRVD